jgi:ADP-ribose pyrophosphatase YjhB (NUDIX family)
LTIEPWNVPNAKLGAGAVVIDNDKVLLVQVNYGPAKGKWILPGGRVEAGEILTAAVIREVKEETGVDVRVDGLLAIRQRTLQTGLLDIYFLFRCEAEKIPANIGCEDAGEITEARFWNIEDALQSPDVRPMSKWAMRFAKEKSALWALHSNLPGFSKTDIIFA